MGKTASGFCLNRIRAHVRVRSPTILSKPEQNGAGNGDKQTPQVGGDNNKEATAAVSITTSGRRVMVVVDSSSEAKNALLWTLSHCVRSQDTIVLLHVAKPSKLQGAGEEANGRQRTLKSLEIVCPLKNICQAKKPEVNVEIVSVEAEDKGAAIVKEARKEGAGLLVLGQKKQWVTWRLIVMWAGKKVSGDGAVEYCINNAHCTAIAVRKKSKKVGGYIITTKRHKGFWLLA